MVYIFWVKKMYTISDAMANILCKGLGIKKERFASPLNVGPHTREYWSVHPNDAIFGAHFNAYSCKWEGSSQAHPNPTAPKIEAAFRWAIASAKRWTSQSSRPPTLMLAPGDQELPQHRPPRSEHEQDITRGPQLRQLHVLRLLEEGQPLPKLDRA